MRRLPLQASAAFLLTGGAVFGVWVSAKDPAQHPQPLDPAQRAQPLDCGGGESEVYRSTFGYPADGSLPAGAGTATEEEAVEAEANRVMVAHDRSSIQARADRLYEVMRNGRAAALFATEELANGRYIVGGGEICSADSKQH